MAILFSEAMDMLKKHFNIQIFASDIDAQAIDHARMAMYPDSIAADVSQERLNKYFVKEDNTYKVKKQIREMIVFAVQNVIKDPPFLVNAAVAEFLGERVGRHQQGKIQNAFEKSYRSGEGIIRRALE